MFYIDNVVETISQLSAVNTIEEASKENIALPFGVRMISRQSAFGGILSGLYSFYDIMIDRKRGNTEEKNFENTVAKVKEIYNCALETLSQDGNNQILDSIPSTNHHIHQQANILLGSTFDRKFSIKASRVYQLLFSSSEEAQNSYEYTTSGFSLASSHAAEAILEDLSGYSKEETRRFIKIALESKTTEELHACTYVLKWIEDLNSTCIDCISPRIFITVIKSYLRENFHNVDDIQPLIWKILWNLYDVGLRIGKATSRYVVESLHDEPQDVRYVYIQSDNHNKHAELEKVTVTYNKKLTDLTSNLLLKWFISDAVSEIALIDSNVPFLLGLWAYQQQFCSFLFPPLPILSVYDDGHTILVQKPISTVADIISTPDAYEEKIRIGALIAKKLLSVDHKAEVDIDTICVMADGSLVSLCPLRYRDLNKYGRFSLSTFEQQMRQIFAESDQVLALVYQMADVWNHPIFIWMEKVICTYGFSLSLGDIDRECRIERNMLKTYVTETLVEETHERFLILLKLYRMLRDRNNYRDNDNTFFKKALYIQRKRAEIFTKDLEKLYQSYLKEFSVTN